MAEDFTRPSSEGGARENGEPAHTIELLWFDGCPNHGEARRLVREVVRTMAPDSVIVDRDASDPEAAQALRFPGSPTIRVDGRDIEPGFVEPADFTPRCRLYRTATGFRGMPKREWIAEALRAGPEALPSARTR